MMKKIIIQGVLIFAVLTGSISAQASLNACAAAIGNDDKNHIPLRIKANSQKD